MCSTCSFRCLGVFLKIVSIPPSKKKKIRKKRRSFVRFTGGNQGGFILQIRHRVNTLKIIPDLIVTGFDDWLMLFWLVVAANPSEKYDESQLGWWHEPDRWKNRIHVPNHQPGMVGNRDFQFNKLPVRSWKDRNKSSTNAELLVLCVSCSCSKRGFPI